MYVLLIPLTLLDTAAVIWRQSFESNACFYRYDAVFSPDTDTYTTQLSVQQITKQARSQRSKGLKRGSGL